MKLLFIILIFLCSVCNAQDTVIVYLDKNYNQIDKSNANFIREVIQANNYFKITDKDIKGRMTNSIEFRSKNPWIAHGKATHYIAPDKLYSKGHYEDGIMVGKWIYYNDIANDTLTYLNKKQLNELLDCPPSHYYDKKKKSEIIGEQVLDSLSNFINVNFHLPARAIGKIDEFNAIINFIIDKNGNVKCPKILNNYNKDIEIEIYRILYNFKFVTGLKRALSFTITFPWNEKGNINENVYLIVDEMPSSLSDLKKHQISLNFQGVISISTYLPNFSKAV